MSGDELRVAPLTVRNPDGSVTVLTANGVRLLLTCPSWCVSGHSYPGGVALVDISHSGEPVWALSHTQEYGESGHVEVHLAQWPYSPRPAPVLCVEAEAGFLELGPPGARKVAQALRAHADTIDALAALLDTIRGRGRRGGEVGA